jgi:hypothetical protein
MPSALCRQSTRPLGLLFALRLACLISFASFAHRRSGHLPYPGYDVLGMLYHEGADRADDDARDPYDQSDHLLLLTLV